MTSRERRANAGNRMAKLLDEEEECQDEFYKTNYGGFEDTESDKEYEYGLCCEKLFYRSNHVF